MIYIINKYKLQPHIERMFVDLQMNRLKHIKKDKEKTTTTSQAHQRAL